MSDPTAQQSYQTAAMHCAERVTLPLKSHVWKGQAGDFLGSSTGSSLDFQDHRNYVPGDDPRHINWQAYARTGTYTMKQYREEVRPTLDVILDLSPSMFFDPLKEKRSCELFYLLHTIALRNGADLNSHLILGPQTRPISSDSIHTRQWTQHMPKKVDEEMTIPPAIQQIPLRHNSIRVFISDLLFEADPSPIISSLTSRQGKLIVLAPFLNSEARPEWSGNYDFIDAELQTKHPHRIDISTLKKYKEKYANHFKLWFNAVQKHQAPMARICCDQELFDSLQTEAIPNQALQLIQT